ncbi:HEPN domain-containing protein [Candidatus Micrarchaeota archaeon]|nr:HEPN domain-containing protein [Candidatus Micrarchaeota archaeon]
MASKEHVERAKKAFEAYRILRGKKLLEDAFSRGYYALLHVGLAILDEAGEAPPKTHAGLVAKLWALKEKLAIPPEWLSKLSRMQSLREGGDYGVVPTVSESDLDSLEKLYYDFLKKVTA